MAEYSGESGFVSKVRKKTDEAVANGLPEAAGLANAVLQYNGQDVIKRVAPAVPAISQQQIATAPAVAPVAQADQDTMLGRLDRSPAANTVRYIARNAIAGAELPLSAVQDVGAKVLNTANQFFGGDNTYFDARNTQRSLDYARHGKFGTTVDVYSSYGPNPGIQKATITPTTSASAPPLAQPNRTSPAVALAAPAKSGQIVQNAPVIAGGKPKQLGQQDITVDQYLTNLSADQAAGRQTGKMPRGVTGSVQVVGDLADESFKPGPKNGAVLTDAGYYTGSDFGNSPLAQGGGKTKLSEIATAADQANQFRQQQAVARQQQIAAQPQAAFKLPSVESYLDKIDPWFRKFDPTKAMLLAHRMRNEDAKVMIAGQEVGQKGQLHAADLQHKQNELAAHKPVYDAQAGYYGAHAKLMEAQSSPEYLMRQERIAQIKDQAARAKEQQKLQQDMAAKWVKGQTGMEHPDDIKTAMSYMAAQDAFNQNFDAFVDKMDKGGRKWFVDGFKQGDQGVLEQLARRGIVKPQSPTFPARNPSTLGLQSEVK